MEDIPLGAKWKIEVFMTGEYLNSSIHYSKEEPFITDSGNWVFFTEIDEKGISRKKKLRSHYFEITEIKE